ncbi:Hypothetical protein Minf_1041 [Methylacidiphilum infernorum V4]|uniref:Uncharacterized protein n=1 Tax=Methylacidiphilum infernorum (isolate V4) TaxID=481448 RepID=B3DUU3_METI4|nr:Hypothetical protein Minf_1041 [Methylacidiphilum infernorum V4]
MFSCTPFYCPSDCENWGTHFYVHLIIGMFFTYTPLILSQLPLPLIRISQLQL